MNLSMYVESLSRQLLTTAETGDAEHQALVERLATSLEAATRLVLLDALSAAADEITRELAPGAVELRLRSGDPEFVVTLRQEHTVEPATETPAVPTGDDGGTSRLNLRLPEALKGRIEEAARKEGLSLNAWLVRAAAKALETAQRPSPSQRGTGGQSYTGWVR